MNEVETVSQACRLVGFDKANLQQMPWEITPPQYVLHAEGTVSSLGVTVSLVHRGIEVFGADAWVVYEVVGCGAWAAIGERHYTAATQPFSMVESTKGVKVVGANGKTKELSW